MKSTPHQGSEPVIKKEKDVFLSSAFREFMDVREKIRNLDKNRIWTVEEEKPDLDSRKGVPTFAIVDTLVEQIRNSKVFICVLRDWYGSSVFDITESVSFLETEIYHASLFHNNVHFFLMEPFNPDQKLSGLMEVIKIIRPGIIPTQIKSEVKVLDDIKRILDKTQTKKHRKWSITLRQLVSQLDVARGHPKPDIEFFDKVFRQVSKKPDKDHLEFLLSGLGNESHIEKRLTRMWIALRELSAAPYNKSEFSEFLPYWDSALSEWASSAAWYGLHGHLYAGRLAAVNSMLQIRERMDWSITKFEPIHFIHGTKGGRASEYYSIALRMTTKKRRDFYFEQALIDLEDALASKPGDPSGYLAIKGHILLIQGNLEKALKIFQDVKKLREEQKDEGGLGEALVDLGKVQMKLGNLSEARRLLFQGLEMLEATERHTFAVRARKWLALSQLKSFHPKLAITELCKAYEHAQNHQIFGQITPLMETIYDWAVTLGFWKKKENEHF